MRNWCVKMNLRDASVYVMIWTCVWIRSQCSHDEQYNLYGYEDPSKNLIKNWDFEQDFAEDDSDWYVAGASTRFFTSDAYTGSRCVKVYQMSDSRYSGVFQLVTAEIKPNTEYYLSAFVKPTKNSATGLFFQMRMSMKEDPGGRHQVARFPNKRKNSEWRQIGGDFTTGEGPINSLRFEIEVDKKDVEYLIDTVSLIELEWNPHWKIQAAANIDKYRKNQVTLKMALPKNTVPYCKMDLRLTQTKRHFGFGTAIRAEPFREKNQFGDDYRNFVFDKFEWGVFENAMKWRPMEPNQPGGRKLARVDECLDYLEAYNFSMRGHAVLWSIQDYNPDWLKALAGDPVEFKNQIKTRINYVVDHFKGRLIQWDVVNENLHGTYYSTKLSDPYFVDDVHKRVRKVDPDVQLCLNDYQALRSGDYTSALADQAYDLMSRNIPIDCIGIQSHLRTLPLSPQVIKKRLEIVTQTGLPVVLSEVSIHTTDVALRAWQLEVLFTMAFSNPNITAILLWQFSDIAKLGFEPEETALFNGDDYTPNEAGTIMEKLKKKWRTKGAITPKGRVIKESFMAFHGAYKVDVYYKKTYIKNVTFYLHPGQDILVNIPVSKAELSDALDGDTTNCNPLDDDDDDETNDDDTDPTKPTNKGAGFSRAAARRKSAKVQRMDPVAGTNKANKS